MMRSPMGQCGGSWVIVSLFVGATIGLFAKRINIEAGGFTVKKSLHSMLFKQWLKELVGF